MKNYPTLESFLSELSDLSEWDLRDKWVSGGQTGGSCWNDGPTRYYPIDADDEPEEENLDNVLQRVIPDLTFLEYRRLKRTAVYEFTDDSSNDYYGNYTRYRIRTLNLETLWRTLSDIEDDRA